MGSPILSVAFPTRTAAALFELMWHYMREGKVDQFDLQIRCRTARFQQLTSTADEKWFQQNFIIDTSSPGPDPTGNIQLLDIDQG